MTSGLADGWTYIIVNFKTGNVIDITDDKISCVPRTNSDNQKWTVQVKADGTRCLIQSFENDKYLSVRVIPCQETGPRTVIIPRQDIMVWNIYKDDKLNFWRIFYPGVSPGLTFDLANYGQEPTIQLWESWDGDHQKWIFECVEPAPPALTVWHSEWCFTPVPTAGPSAITTTDPSLTTTPPPTTHLSSSCTISSTTTPLPTPTP